MRVDVNEKTEKRMRIEIKAGIENLVRLRSIMRFVQCMFHCVILGILSSINELSWELL